MASEHQNLKVWRGLLVLAGLGMLLGTPLPHIDSDAALFGKIAQTIVDTGEWMTLRHPVHPDWVVDKPPLTFWLMALSLALGGQTDAALRLWHILLSLALVWAVYRLGRTDGTEEEALLGAMVMATIQQVFYASMAPQHDVPVTLFLTLAFYAALRYGREGTLRWTVLLPLWTVLAVLTKGVLWLPVVVGILAADRVAARLLAGVRTVWRLGHGAAAAVIFLAVAAPWFVVGAIRQGAPFVRVFLVDENGIARLEHAFLGGGLVPLHGVLPMAAAYVPLLMVGMLPWTSLLPGAVAEGWRGLREGPPAVRLCALWFGLYFLVLSLSQGDRIIRYLLPCYPPLAVLTGRFLARLLDGRASLGAAAMISPGLGLPLMGIGLWLARRVSPFEMTFYTPIILPTLAVFALTLVLSASLSLRGRLVHAVALTVVGSVLSYLLAYAMLMERWPQLWPWPSLGATINRLYRPGDRVMVVGVNPAETNFAAYWVHARVEQVEPTTLLAAWPHQRVFALLPPGELARLVPRIRPTVLLQTPLGWILVTNGPPPAGKP